MDIELVESDETSHDTAESQEVVPVISTRSTEAFERINGLLKAIDIKAVRAKNGVEVLQRYIQQDTPLIIIDFNLPKLGSVELLDQIARINVSSKKVTRVLVICEDSSRETINKVMRPVKASKGLVKLGLLITPWNVPDFYRQISNLHPEDQDIKSRTETTLNKFRQNEIDNLNETRLFLGVSEIGQGLRIELGNDRVLSSTSVTADDYVEKIEKALLSSSVEYIQFSLEATTDLLPSNVVALMMLINGFATKRKKEILFVSIPPEVKKQIESFGLTEILPLEKDVDLF